jgi:hypothetical protein
MKSIVALVLVSLWFSLGITSHAQTPDGMTPAVEDECFEEVGAAYGLCTAYCEAMDCDNDEPWASEEACASVKTDFENYTGYLLPCDPCLYAVCEVGEECVDGACSVGGDTDSSGSDDTLPGGSGTRGGSGTNPGGSDPGDIPGTDPGGGLGDVGGF